MTNGFGRKGLAAGTPARTSFGQAVAARTPAASPPPETADMSPQLAAFLAEERARKAAAGEAIVGGLSEQAVGYRPAQSGNGRQRSLLLAYVLWYFAGLLGAHRFYLGDTRNAIIQVVLWFVSVNLAVAGFVFSFVPLMALGGLGVMIAGLWLIADLFLIPGIRRRTSGDPASAFA